MYKEYFGLKDNPFSITPDPRYVYMSPHHREALGHLLYGTGEDGGFVQITGEVGTGKTTLIRTLLEQDMPAVDVALILNPRLNVDEFLAAICDELRIEKPPQPSLKQLVDALNAHLLKTHSEGKRTVLIVDEAQHLNRDVLEQVRLLTNLETHRHKLLRIMLVGQPELRDLLAREDLRQLAQRITARYHLDSLSAQQTREYVQHRLQVAGGRPGIFAASALKDVYRITHGTPRLINVICDRALLGAYGQGQTQVSRAILRQAAKEVFDQGGHSRPGEGGPRVLPWLIMLATSLVLGVSLYLAQPIMDRLSLAVDETAAEDIVAVPDEIVAEQTAETGAAQKPEQTTNVEVTQPAPEPEVVKPEPAWLLAQDAAFNQLAKLWGVQANSGQGLECLDIERRGLRCQSSDGSWAGLRGYNLPVILELEQEGQASHVLVRRLNGGKAVLLTPNGQSEQDLASLSEQWTGRYQLIWRPQIKATSVGPNSEQSAIRWLLQRLDMAEGSANTVVSLPYRYDAAVRERVRRFQDAKGLDADGLVGPQTMIHLNALAPKPGTPVLVGGG